MGGGCAQSEPCELPYKPVHGHAPYDLVSRICAENPGGDVRIRKNGNRNEWASNSRLGLPSIDIRNMTKQGKRAQGKGIIRLRLG
jgi:hypothetical protein